jgi:hypothetical protein
LRTRRRAEKWASEPPRKDSTLKGIDGHEFLRFAHFFWDARVPVFNAHEDALAVIVTGVADIERPTRIPIWWTGTATDVSRSELTGNLLDDVFEGVVSEVTCFENFILPELTSRGMPSLGNKTEPTYLTLRMSDQPALDGSTSIPLLRVDPFANFKTQTSA